MPTPPYDHVVLLGRLQPVHHGHAAALRRALELGERVVVLVGSADAPLGARDPFSFEQRSAMLRAAMGEDAWRLIVRPVVDHLYNEDAWRAEVQAALLPPLYGEGQTRRQPRQGGETADLPTRPLRGHPPHKGEGERTALLGRAGGDAWRDAFPQHVQADVEPVETPSPEDLRARLFADDPEAVRADLPAAVFDLIRGWREDEAFARAREEQRHIESYRRAWSVAPYPPVFVTADPVVTCDGCVLLVERAGQPGRGLWALPGGFVDPYETTLEGAVREAGEETGLPPEALRGALKAREVFDAPDRSLRGRTITHAFHFELPTGPLPQVAGADDAAQARWIPLAELRGMRGRLFEDHYFILERLLGLA